MEELKGRIKELEQTISELRMLSMVLVWDGEETLSVRVCAPSVFDAAAAKVFRRVSHMYGLSDEQRGRALHVQVRVQLSAEEVDQGEPQRMSQEEWLLAGHRGVIHCKASSPRIDLKRGREEEGEEEEEEEEEDVGVDADREMCEVCGSDPCDCLNM